MREGKGLRAGFTLVEMAIATLLIGLVAAIGIPAIQSSLNQMKLDAAAEELAVAISYTRSLAVRDGMSTYGVALGVDSFRCFETAPANLILHPLDKKGYVVDLQRMGHLKGITIDSQGLTGNPVGFDAFGEPTSTGDILLALGAKGNRTVRITSPFKVEIL
jgi:prepilin-type N-terminal cleavage/methylation domain-containing protein